MPAIAAGVVKSTKAEFLDNVREKYSREIS
jgi:hypothetical protein